MENNSNILKNIEIKALNKIKEIIQFNKIVVISL